ncbi:hypothetical protein X777_09616, partial [Ooceraea biroi]
MTIERDLLEEANNVATLGEYFTWVQQCDEFIEQSEENSCAKRPRLSIGNRQSLVARIARLEGLKKRLERRFIHFGGDYAEQPSSAELSWREIDTAFENRILTGAVINANYIEPRRFLEDARDVVLDHVRNAIEQHNSVKVNTVFNGEFVAEQAKIHLRSKLAVLEINRCLHYFYSNEKLEAHTVDCNKMNDCAIILPNEEDKWLTFNNHSRKERMPFVVYADLECILQKTNEDPKLYQRHQVFSIGYYVRCSYDDSLSGYRSRRDIDCISWFVEQLKDLAHRVKA